jgi:predicted RNase H-like nuclease
MIASPDITGENEPESAVGQPSGTRVTGVDASRRGWVAVSLPAPSPAALSQSALSPAALSQSALSPAALSPSALSPAAGGLVVTVKVAASLGVLLAPELGLAGTTIVGIDMPLGLLETGWREADRAARGLLGPRRSSVFAIPPRAVWAATGYPAANQRCRELTGQGFSAQAWGLRAKLLEANQYRQACGHPLYEVHPELAFGAMAGAPLAASKHTGPGREERRRLLARHGIEIPAGTPPTLLGDVLDAAAVAWSARRIAAGQAVTVPAIPQHDDQGAEIAIRF